MVTRIFCVTLFFLALSIGASDVGEWMIRDAEQKATYVETVHNAVDDETNDEAAEYTSVDLFKLCTIL